MRRDDCGEDSAPHRADRMRYLRRRQRGCGAPAKPSCGAPLLAAISGPTGLAVRVAQQAELTLVGFARGNRLTVYTHPERLVVS